MLFYRFSEGQTANFNQCSLVKVNILRELQEAKDICWTSYFKVKISKQILKVKTLFEIPVNMHWMILCPVTVLLPKSFNTFGILPLWLLFFYDGKKKSLLLLLCRLT